MARRITTAFYEVTPTEGLTLQISGPDDPYVALDDTSLSVKEGKPFRITPEILNGAGGHHFLTIVLLFPSEEASASGYVVTVSDDGGAQLETISKSTPDRDHHASIDAMIRVASTR